MKLQNTFSKGTVNKDLDARFVDANELIDAENFFVTTVDGASGGVGKNALGNALKTSYSVPGGKTVGVGISTANNKVYNLVKATDYDYVIEYDSETNESVTVLQSTTGTLLNFKEGERVRNVDIIVNDAGEGNFIAFSGDTNPPRLFNIEVAKTWGVDGFIEDEISVMKPSPIFAPSIVLTTSVDGVNNNFIENKFINIGYRYKYFDGFVSAISSWTRVAFEPKNFELDYQTYENKGMLNLANAVDISFNTGPREVVEVELVFKESNTDDVYVIDSFKKSKLSWANDTIESFQLSKSKILKVLAAGQYTRNFDNVPLAAVAQTTIGNRLAYANYIEGHNLDVDIDFDVSLVSTSPLIGGASSEIADFTDVVNYSNVIDFEYGIAVPGVDPVYQMNYTTNELNINTANGAGSCRLFIYITPKPSYSTVPYTITVKNGNTVVQSWETDVVGIQSKEYATNNDENIKIYITSSNPIIYDCRLLYQITYSPSGLEQMNHYAEHQLSFPKSTGYDATLEGDSILKAKYVVDMSAYEFISGQQIRIDHELQSSLVEDLKIDANFFYSLTDDYASLSDFIDNSSFRNQLEEVFSIYFKDNLIAESGPIVSFTGFKLSVSGTDLIIVTPKIVYEVTEPSNIVDNKNEFYIVNKIDFITIVGSTFSSLHSNRDIEACVIYMDNKGRKTSALTSKNNTIYIPAENSILVNKLKVTLNNPPPSWAKYYKFGIKQTKRDYETIYGNEVYKDGIYRWIKLVGENKNKVKEGDVLIVKSDYSGPVRTLETTKVLEIATKDQDFVQGNQISSGQDLIESSGLYMKLKQGSFNINVTQESFQSFLGYGKRDLASQYFVTTEPLFGNYVDSNFVPYPVNAGSQMRFYINMKAYGAIAFENKCEVIKTAEQDYASIQLWWEAEVENLDVWTEFFTENLTEYKFDTDGKSFSAKPNRNGTASRDIMTEIIFDANFAGGTLVFETEPFEDLSSPFFETPETFTINNGVHETSEHILNEGFNCFAFGNGVESFKIQDAFTGKSFSIDSNPTLVDKEGYRQFNRNSDITYSEVFNSGSNVNRLNEFNLSLANFKEDIDKSYGAIYKVKGEETDLQVYQEGICSQVFYGKDFLYNADGSTNLTQVSNVLGRGQKMYQGNFGISTHSDSYDLYANNAYHTDVNHGVVLKKSNNGLFEISSQGLKSYWKNLFRNNTINQVNGKYDQFNDIYILNVKYNTDQYVTWVYSDKDNGWLGRISFNPEDMCCINGKFLAFFEGQIYEHNQLEGRNTFFGVQYPSTFTFNFSQNPSERKIYKNAEIEGTDAWQLSLKTDLDKGYVNESDFLLQEGVYRAYTRTSNDVIDTSLLSCQGIGECALEGLVLSFAFNLENEVSVGDRVLNINQGVVGTILSKTTNSLTLDAVANITSGDYVLCSKPQNSESRGLLGYHMEVTAILSKTTKVEVFSVNSEVVKSFI
jgi:hypothetical protein